MSEETSQSPAPLQTTLLDYEKTLDCVHCGLCLTGCPTYQETGREGSSPRGRISAMRGVAEGRLALDRDVVDEMYLCLDCRACESVCPAGVQFGRLVESMRAEIDARGARPLGVRLLQRAAFRGVIGSPAVTRILSAALRVYQRRGLERLVHATGVLRLIPRLSAAERMLPRLSDPHRPPILVPAEGERRGRVGFFVGCLMPHLFGAVNEATIRVLARNGFEVSIPPSQRCCGALHAHGGDLAGADRVRLKNRSAFHVHDLDAIIVNSAGCGAALKETDDELGRKVRDVAEFLDDVGLHPPRGRLDLQVAYDDPCHLLHAQGISEAPRALLRQIPGVRLVDLPGASDCCGAAGVYAIVRPAMSKRLLDRKIRAIRALGPDVVATGNPGCLMQIQAGLREAELDVETLHPVELLDRAYRSEGHPRG